MSLLELVHTIDPHVLERARRLETAMRLLRAGHTRRECSGMIRVQFAVSQQSAWRIVDMAFDMAGEVKE